MPVALAFGLAGAAFALLVTAVLDLRVMGIATSLMMVDSGVLRSV